MPQGAKALTGLDGTARTQLNLDKTLILRDIVTKVSDPLQVLGELQFAFVTFVLGENFDSFEQWKRLVVLLGGCREALMDAKLKDLYFKLIPVLYA